MFTEEKVKKNPRGEFAPSWVPYVLDINLIFFFNEKELLCCLAVLWLKRREIPISTWLWRGTGNN